MLASRARAQGEWVHPMVPNPEFKDDESIGKYQSFGVAGIEVWQVKAGTIFDNILLTDDPAEAEALRKATWEAHKDAEKAAFDKHEEEKRKADAAKTESSDSAGDDEDEEEDEAEADAAKEGDEPKDEL